MDQNERMKYIDGSRVGGGGGVPCCFSTVLSFDSFLRPSVLNAAFLFLSFPIPIPLFPFKYPFSWERETREMYTQNGNATHGRLCFFSATSVRLLFVFSFFSFSSSYEGARRMMAVPRQTEPPEFVTNEAIACAVRRRCTPFLIIQVRLDSSSSSSSTYDAHSMFLKSHFASLTLEREKRK